MAQSSYGQNSPLAYMDGVSVKISENYKPPKRITMVMSYSQRVTLNKLIQEPKLTYEFSLEESIKNKMHEWRKARSAVKEQRKQRLNITQETNGKMWENKNNVPNKEVLEIKDSVHNDNATDSSISKQDINVKCENMRISAEPYYQTESGILIPKILNSQQQSKVLTPTPLMNTQPKVINESRDVKNYTLNNNPFNFSEFESDTSSPFDNMELKTINDLEELAQVLKNDSDDNAIANSVASSQQKTYVTTCHASQNNLTNNVFIPDNLLNNHTSAYHLLESSVGVDAKKIPLNGYYYDNYIPSTLSHHHQILKTQMAHARDTPLRSVPEIMRSLEADLASNHLESVVQYKSTSASESASVPVSCRSESLEDPFKNLNPDFQKMAVTISCMGFPLPRVARACQDLEGNQKKIVEHLLALSELMDLGFPEEKVVIALLKCENDRDKALDLLIT